MATDDPHFKIRLPAELKQRLESAAVHNGLSLTAEIVRRLEESFVRTGFQLPDMRRLPQEMHAIRALRWLEDDFPKLVAETRRAEAAALLEIGRLVSESGLTDLEPDDVQRVVNVNARLAAHPVVAPKAPRKKKQAK